ncbi:MAG: selenocysteine-specific translation elongation factor [Dehalococcoidales bacterium]|nr:selenocysteine-specific translation elongation factor [Dehalococcoidales bacterium]
MFVIGTAGHIDHGKSVLVRALTGIDPDRLREEKERGMTIDLGFAWLKLPDGQEVGIVDVPGHERLIKNMLAGVGGIDLALLIIDAGEGVMPQTREHLAILNILGIERGIAVLTKKDLVDDERLALARGEVTRLLAPTTLARSPIVAVSALTGEGLADLTSAIGKLLGSTPLRKDIGRPRLPIDRVFTIAGSGTIVTGTLIDGSLSTGQEVELIPAGLRSRIRRLQTHKTSVETAAPGSRVGVNLTGIAATEPQRGDVLTIPGWLSPTTMLSVKLCLLPHLQHPLSHGTTVNFYAGSTQAESRVRLLEKDELKPGETGWAQLLLNKPVALVKGDRFIIRSPEATLGGGEVLEPHTRRHRRLHPNVIENLRRRAQGTPEEMIMAILEGKPLKMSELSTQSGLTVSELSPAVASLIEQSKIVRIGRGESELLLTATGWENLAGRVTAILKDYHLRFPSRPGMPRAELSSRLKMTAPSPAIIKKLLDDGNVIEDSAAIRLATHHVQLTKTQQAQIDTFLKSLAESPYAPPGGLIPEADLLKLIVARNQVIKISEEVVFSRQAYNEMVAGITSHLKEAGSVTVAEVRDMFKTSRKYALALLEYLDGAKVTRRLGDRRVLYRESGTGH